jgi:hypothetical protein
MIKTQDIICYSILLCVNIMSLIPTWTDRVRKASHRVKKEQNILQGVTRLIELVTSCVETAL